MSEKPVYTMEALVELAKKNALFLVTGKKADGQVGKGQVRLGVKFVRLIEAGLAPMREDDLEHILKPSSGYHRPKLVPSIHLYHTLCHYKMGYEAAKAGL